MRRERTNFILNSWTPLTSLCDVQPVTVGQEDTGSLLPSSASHNAEGQMVTESRSDMACRAVGALITRSGRLHKEVSECLSGVGAGDAGGDHQSTCYRQSLPARPAQPAVNECIGNIFVQFVKR